MWNLTPDRVLFAGSFHNLILGILNLLRIPNNLAENPRRVVRAAGVEPTTYGFGDRHSIQLSYARNKS